MAIINVRTGSYFPDGFVFAGGIVALAGLLLLFVNWMFGLPTLLTGIVISTTHYRLIVDPTKKVYRECVWFFGFSSGPQTKFENIEYLFIKTSKESQTMYVRVARTTIQKRVFDGYLKFSDTDKVHVASVDKKSHLMSRLQPISAALGVPIKDYSAE